MFKGNQLTMIGRYKNDSDLRNITLLLKGRSGRESRSFKYDNLDFPVRSEDNNFLPRLWASRRVGWLIEQIRLNGETKELRDEVTDLGTRYGIVTPYTSYLATDGTLTSAPRESVQFRELAKSAPAKMKDDKGSGAVRQSIQQNAMQANSMVVDGVGVDEEDRILISNSKRNQFVGAKNFFNQSNVWVDYEFSEASRLPEFKVKFASDEYFALISREKGLAQYLSLGEEVVVVWKNKVYRIVK
ncbi:MAG: hypothetical protein H7070_12200 [Saprospiraceae bacterium]|nr:hypothetical protein [Pyrinomonadaceae bacterium]